MKKFLLCMLLVVLMCSCACADVKLNDENFPDIRFRAWIWGVVDTDRNRTLTDAEIAAITAFDITSPTESYDISSLKGIEFFPNLQALYNYLLVVYQHFQQVID